MYGQVLMIGGMPAFDLPTYLVALPIVLHGLVEYLLDSYAASECRWTVMKKKYVTHRALYLAAAQVIVLHLDNCRVSADYLEKWLEAALATAYASGRMCPYIVIVTAQPPPAWVSRLQVPYLTPLPLVILAPLPADQPEPIRHFLHAVADMAWTRTPRLKLQATTTATLVVPLPAPAAPPLGCTLY